MGQVKQRGKVWWVRVLPEWQTLRGVQRQREEESRRDAPQAPRRRLRKGIAITPTITRSRVEEALADVLTDYRTNGKRSLDVAERRIEKHLTPFFGAADGVHHDGRRPRLRRRSPAGETVARKAYTFTADGRHHSPMCPRSRRDHRRRRTARSTAS